MPIIWRVTARDWVNLLAKGLHTEPRLTMLPAWMVSILGLFIPIMREFKEMLYQYDRDYVFDSSKYEKHFGHLPTPPEEAVRAAVAGNIS